MSARIGAGNNVFVGVDVNMLVNDGLGVWVGVVVAVLVWVGVFVNVTVGVEVYVTVAVGVKV